MASFGPRHRVVPNQNLGQNGIAQRRLVEAAGRAAEKTRISVSVDAHQCIVHLRNPRGTIACPCSSDVNNVGDEQQSGSVVLDGGEGDGTGSIDVGYPLDNARDAGFGEALPADNTARDVGLAVQRLLMGNGRRCGICWGTGWIDGYQMWGGNRRIMCVTDAPGVALVRETGLVVDTSSTTPTMLGPGEVVWKVRINACDVILDALRVRDGLVPSRDGYRLDVSNDGVAYDEPSRVLSGGTTSGPNVRRIVPGTYWFRLVLESGARASHVELFSRSEPLVNMQLPQLVQSASAELVAPFLNEDFEIDPVVGNVERGTIFDVRQHSGIGEVWMVTDVTVKKTAGGQIFGVVGTAKNAQPTDTFACASISDDLQSGVMDRGRATRGLESNGMGTSMGLGDAVDESTAAARRGSTDARTARNAAHNTIVLSNGELD